MIDVSRVPDWFALLAKRWHQGNFSCNFCLNKIARQFARKNGPVSDIGLMVFDFFFYIRLNDFCLFIRKGHCKPVILSCPLSRAHSSDYFSKELRWLFTFFTAFHNVALLGWLCYKILESQTFWESYWWAMTTFRYFQHQRSILGNCRLQIWELSEIASNAGFSDSWIFKLKALKCWSRSVLVFKVFWG